MKLQDFAEELVKRVDGLIGAVLKRVTALEARGDSKALELRLALLEAKLAGVEKAVGPQQFCGIYERGIQYRKGNYVTHAGSLWCARDDTGDPPGTEVKAWQLVVKRGRDGRDMTRDVA